MSDAKRHHLRALQSVPSEDRGCVLFAAPVTGEPAEALIRAAALSFISGSDLVVLRVLGRSNPGSRHAASDLKRVVTRTLKWCSRVLPPPLAPGSVVTREGDFLSVVAEASRAIGASLIVVPDLDSQTGRSLDELVLEAEVPILLARSASDSGSIVAATDLKAPGFPCLRISAMLSGHLEVPVVFVHNVAPSGSAPADDPGLRPKRIDATDPMLDRLQRLRTLASEFGVDCESIVLCRPTLADAALEVSSRERPDLMIVPARRQSPDGVPAAASVAEKVIDEAACSVLVVPVWTAGNNGAFEAGRVW